MTVPGSFRAHSFDMTRLRLQCIESPINHLTTPPTKVKTVEERRKEIHCIDLSSLLLSNFKMECAGASSLFTACRSNGLALTTLSLGPGRCAINGQQMSKIGRNRISISPLSFELIAIDCFFSNNQIELHCFTNEHFCSHSLPRRLLPTGIKHFSPVLFFSLPFYPKQRSCMRIHLHFSQHFSQRTQ